MHHTHRVQAPGKDAMREYQKQKERLQLIEMECIIEWTKRSILASKAKLSRLSSELATIHRYLQALEDEKKMILTGLSQQDAWLKPETQRQTLQLLDINPKIRDAEAAVERIREKTLAPTQEIEELESYEIELKRELKEATRKWCSRWPEQEECCMILKLELSRAQAELDATYQQIEKQFAEMAAVKVDHTLIEVAPCPIFAPQMDAKKDKKVGRKVAATVTEDLIAFETELLKGCEVKMGVTEVEDAIDWIDLLADYQDENSIIEAVIEQRDNSDILVDLDSTSSTENQGKDEVSQAARTSDDLAVLIRDFPIWCANSGNEELPTTITTLRDPANIVQVLSKGYGQLINNRFESSKNELRNKKTEIERLCNEVKMMQPLYDIGLAIRKRQVEVRSGKPGAEKDSIMIAKGNSAAHNAQVLADATWMMAPPFEQRFKELYNDVPAEKVWEHRESTVFLDILNWKLDMNLFAPMGGVDKKTFNKLFNSVFPRIYPSFKISDKDLVLDKDLSNAIAGMKAEHSNAYERDVQARIINRCFLKVQRRVNRQTQTQTD